ncbi:MAG: MarR family winged helix-turn-helix transcriptional regulator [Bacteroides sp.]|nr:MarR family transcriptional regulator [Clostridia bacterium]
MNYNLMLQNDRVEFGQMPPEPFLIGLLSAFENRFQAVADSFFEEITWKQFFAVICINLCKESPTINDLAEVMGSSHQNVKQILLKLERKGFIKMIPDENDRRKQRIVTTKKCDDFCKKNDKESQVKINQMYEGVTEEQLLVTIQTISRMERNLRK